MNYQPSAQPLQQMQRTIAVLLIRFCCKILAMLRWRAEKSSETVYIPLWLGQKALEMLPVNLLSGRLPENSSEVVVPAHLAANGGVKFSIGETITLFVGNRINGNESLSQHNPYVAGAEILEPVMQKSYTVVGICQRPTVEEYSAPGYTLITAADNSSADDVALFITLKILISLLLTQKDVVGDGSYVLNDNVLRFMGLSSEKLMMVLLYAIVAILVILVVVGSVFFDLQCLFYFF